MQNTSRSSSWVDLTTEIKKTARKLTVIELRTIYKFYPKEWVRLLKLHKESKNGIKIHGHSLEEYDERFYREWREEVPIDSSFRWSMLDDLK